LRNNLIGLWVADPESMAEGEMDNSSLEFCEDGNLIYTIHETESDQKALLVYEVNGDVLVTDQPSAPQREETKFFFNSDGKLVLDYDGSWSVYVRSS